MPKKRQSAAKTEVPRAGAPEKHRLLVAVDFGTTYTGVAYCLSSNTSLGQIETITTWPACGGSVEKIPTELAYLPDQEPKWGAEANGTQYSKGSTSSPEVYGRFKLLLDPSISRTVYGEASQEETGEENVVKIPIPASKTAIQLCTDYLKQLYKHTMGILKKRMPDTLADTPIEFIFTVPAIWSHKAQEATRTAASRAGFGSGGRKIDSMSMISEPEAAAVYALATLHEDRKNQGKGDFKATELQPGEHFIICDAGGGTVDLITYQVQEVFPDLKLRESVVGGGGKCGSTYIDDGFNRLLRERIGPSFDDTTIWTAKKKGKGSQLMQKFEACKRTFGEDDSESWFLELPVAVNNDYDNRISDGEIELSSDDMKLLFDPVVDEIIQLVKSQAKKVKSEEEEGQETAGKLSTIILVGGFGESRYLYNKLEEWAQQQSPPLKVVNPTKSWSAIARGAVLQALRPAVRTRKLRCHYGFEMVTEFDPKYHKRKDAMLCQWSGQWVVDDNVQWAASMGDDCSEEKEFCFNVFYEVIASSDLKTCCELRLLGSRYHDAPREASSPKVFNLGLVPLDFSDLSLKTLPKKRVEGEMNYQINCVVRMKVGSADASFSVWIDDKCYASSRIAYND
ncbi:hypothetical protein TWF730_007346 [Orbilia blumenaviensis]|uniref:Actin-like ATPase domain-containing protein n=1 Tax=Orbilia blumenaviensis TaxID=1796055 RepID=A0AAV9V9A8_9PEZI